MNPIDAPDPQTPSAPRLAKASAPGNRRGIFGRFRRDRKGAAAIEFAFLAVPFFLILFATLETGMVFLAELTLDQAVEKAGRSVRTGEVQKSAMTEAAFRKGICDQVSFLLKCDELMIDLATYPDYASIPRPLNNGVLDTSGFGYKPGTAESVNALRVFYRWPIVTDLMRQYMADSPDGSYLLYSVAAFKAEPF